MQERIFNLALRNPSHPFISNLVHLSSPLPIILSQDDFCKRALGFIEERHFESIAKNVQSVVSASFNTPIPCEKLIDALGQFTHLKQLSLRRIKSDNVDMNFLLEKISAILKNLEHLSLKCSRSSLFKKIIFEKSLAVLPKTLTSFSCTGCDIENVQLRQLQKLSSLTELDLSQSVNFSNLTFSDFPQSLEVLRLRECMIEDNNLLNIENLYHLRELNLSGNDLSGATLKLLPQSIKKLNLSFNPLTEAICNQLRDHTGITEIDFSSTPHIEGNIASLPRSLEKITFSGLGELDELTILALQHFPRLTHCYIGTRKLSNSEMVARFPTTLTHLSLISMEITENVCKHLHSQNKLIKLNLSGHLLTQSDFSQLSESILHLKVNFCSLTDEALQKVCFLKNLQSLSIACNPDITSKALSLLPSSITKLDLAACIELDESVFENIAHLTNLKSLNLIHIPSVTGTDICLLPKSVNKVQFTREFFSPEAIQYLQQHPNCIEVVAL